MSRLDAKFLKDFWVKETPSGTINGSNTAFTLAQTPQENEAVQLFLDGLYLIEGTDYTLSGTSITMTTAPVLGQVLKAQYVRNQGE
jgi:hypothetical protein